MVIARVSIVSMSSFEHVEVPGAQLSELLPSHLCTPIVRLPHVRGIASEQWRTAPRAAALATISPRVLSTSAHCRGGRCSHPAPSRVTCAARARARGVQPSDAFEHQTETTIRVPHTTFEQPDDVVSRFAAPPDCVRSGATHWGEAYILCSVAGRFEKPSIALSLTSLRCTRLSSAAATGSDP
jgi:hypothetical protein